MANTYKQILALANKNNMGLSNTIKRDYGIPLDYSSVQETYDSALNYAKTSTLAYIGQPISVGDTLYIITDEAGGYLKAVGTIPTGDEASITVAEDGRIALKGFETAGNLTLPRKKVDGTIEWVTIDTIVSNDSNTKTVITSVDGSDIIINSTYDDTTDTYTYFLDVVFPGIPEYSIIKEVEESQVIYGITRDNIAIGEPIVVPNAYNDIPLANRLSGLEARKYADDIIYDSTSQKIYLLSNGERFGAGFDAPAFIKDGMVESAALIDNKLVITWNSDVDVNHDGQKDVTEINLSELIDVYEAGRGITVNGKVIAIDENVVATVAALAEIRAKVDLAQTSEQVNNTILSALVPYATYADIESQYATKAALATTDNVAIDTQNRVSIVEGKIAGLISPEGGELNVIEKVKVNGVTQPVTDKEVSISIPVKVADLADGLMLQDAINTAQIKVASHTASIESLNAKDAELLAAIQQNTAKFSDYPTISQVDSKISSQITGLDLSKYATTAGVSSISTRVDTLEAADSTQDSLITSNTDAITSISKKIGGNYSELNTVASAIAEAKQAADAASIEINDLIEGQVATNTSNIQKVQDDLTEEVATRIETEAALDNRIVKVEAFFDGAAKDSEGLNNALDKLVEIQEYLSGEGAVTDGLLSAVSEHDKNIAELQGIAKDGGTLDVRVDNAETAISDVKSRTQTLESIIKGYDTESSIKAALDSAISQANKGVEDASKAQTAADAAQKDVDELEKVVDIVEQILGNTQTTANDAQEQAETNAEDITSIKNTFIKVTADNLYIGENLVILDCGGAPLEAE